MSYTEVHTGKLKLIETDYNLEHLQVFLELNKEFYVDDLQEKIDDNYNYFEIYNNKTKKIACILHNNKLYYVEDHYQSSEADYLQDVKEDSEGNINFNLIFYNGGTCFSEMLEEGLNELN